MKDMNHNLSNKKSHLPNVTIKILYTALLKYINASGRGFLLSFKS